MQLLITSYQFHAWKPSSSLSTTHTLHPSRPSKIQITLSSLIPNYYYICRNPNMTPVCDCWTFHFKTMGINMLLKQPPFFWRGVFFKYILNLLAGIFSLSATRALVRLSCWCWVIRPCTQLAFQWIPKTLDGVEVRALRCLPSQVLPQQTRKTVSLWTLLCTCWNRKYPMVNILHLYSVFIKSDLQFFSPSPIHTDKHTHLRQWTTIKRADVTTEIKHISVA